MFVVYPRIIVLRTVSVPVCRKIRSMVPDQDARPGCCVLNVELIFALSTAAVSGSNPTRPSGVIRFDRSVPVFSSATVGAAMFEIDGTE
jgi:hypothetical protein